MILEPIGLNMMKRPIVVDRCCPPRLARYLKEMGNEVVYIGDSRPDSAIVSLANDMGAYIVTADNGATDGDLSLREYQNTYLTRPDKKPKFIWRDLKYLMKAES